MSRPVLYHYWMSSASWRVRWALAIKGIEHDKVSVNLSQGEQLSDEHRRRNPMGHVPALALGDHCLSESVAIFEWLEETHPEPHLYPGDAWQRARTRQVVELCNAGIQPLQNLAALARHSTDPEEKRGWAHHFNERGMRALERLLRGIDGERHATGLPAPRTFAVGDALTAADLFVVPQVGSARRFGVDLDPYPRVLAAEAAALATTHAEGALPWNQPDAPRS